MDRKIGLAAVFISLTACSAIDRANFHAKYFWPTKAEEIAETHVAVTMVAPWEQYINALKTDFKLDEDAALAQSVPQTAAFISKVIDAKTLQARLALQQKAVTKTVTHTDTEDTSSYQRDEKPGDPSAIDLSDIDLSKLSAAGLPTIATAPSALTDASLHYQTAAALLQEVELINRHVENAALDHDCRAYLVRMQASVMPRRKALPYDTYIDIALNKVQGTQPSKCSRIVPLLVTDEVTAASEQQAIDTLRQIEAGISFLTAGGSGDVTGSSLNEALQQGAGTRIGSVLMIGTPDPQTLRVRIGSQIGADSKFDMIARTYNITAVMLTDQVGPGSFTPTSSLVVATKYDNRYTGEILADANSETLPLAFPRVGDFAQTRPLGGDNSCSLDTHTINATLVLDEKKPAQALVSNYYRDRTTNLMAYLEVGEHRIPADAIAARDAFNKTILVTFPDWTTYSTSPAKPVKGAPKDVRQSLFDLLSGSPSPSLCLLRRETGWRNDKKQTTPCSCLPLLVAKKVSAEDKAAKTQEKPTSGATVTVSAVVADAKGDGKLKIYVSPDTSDPKAGVKPVRLTLKGAEINTVTDTANTAVTADVTPLGVGWKIRSASTVLFSLSGLVPGSQLEVLAAVGDKELPPIKLPVTAPSKATASTAESTKP